MAFAADSYIDMELENQMPELSTSFLEDQLLNSHNSFAIPHTNFYSYQSPGFPGKLEDTLSSDFESFDPVDRNSVQPVQYYDQVLENKNTKSMDMSERSSRSSVTLVSQSLPKNKNNCGKRKRVKINEKEDEKSKEVIHVRARRGQATDRHSLAERLRRQKINQRLKCLKDIIPGCYKAKGLASMLDEIINYVQCLHNQIEFLSMKLTTASTLYDFNSKTNLIDTMQAKEQEKSTTDGQGELLNFQPAWPF